MTNPHLLSVDEVVREFSSHAVTGLTDTEAKARLQQYGANELIEKGRRSVLAILFDQIKGIMVLILLGAAVISFFLNEYIDAAVILIIVILNTTLGFWQEYNAENALAALKKLAVPKVRVRRDEREKEIAASELVPGDIVILEAGNIIPADARLLTAVNLKVQEAALTGESEPVEKNIAPLSVADIPLADRKNMIYLGTVVTFGRGRALVTETGMKTELGKIATLLQEMEEEEAPLQKRLAKLGKTLTVLALILIAVVATLTYFQGAGWKEMFMTAISMAVAAIPEGLPAVVTIALALGAQRMFKSKSLIRNLPAVETLGSVTVICSDKTGTLTQNKMTVTNLVLPDQQLKLNEIDNNQSVPPSIGLLLLASALCNDAELSENDPNGEHQAIGDPTEGALVLAAAKMGLVKNQLSQDLPRVNELPFDSTRKRMSTVHTLQDSSADTIQEIISYASNDYTSADIIFTKGAVDGLMDVCTHVLIDGQIIALSTEMREKILADNHAMAENGIRVLGSAFKFIEPAQVDQIEKFEQELVFIGMIGMIDPVRPEAVEAVRLCQKAGIRVVMITGDHPLTARAIANELGIISDGKFLTGQELSRMSVQDLKSHIDEVSLFARVSPEHKMIIIDAFQEQHQIVAMTGDGVNDAPALKSADIGVAMGITGTDVSRESSDMVLLDDNFATIVAAVKEGRTIYDNIRKFVKYILTGNVGEILVMLTGPLLGMPIPLLPIQILWINLVTDGAPAVALGYEESEKNVMNRPPYQPEEGIFSRGIGRQIIGMGIFIGMLSIMVGFWFWKINPSTRTWQTIIFTTLTFCQMAYAGCIRKNSESIFSINIFGNKALFGAVSLTFLLQLMLIYVPFFQKIFRTVPLSSTELLLCFAVALLVIFASEIEKLVRRRRPVM